jgi:OOP family OmpA-OmpF porin
MASKKYALIVGLLCLIQSGFAQNNDATYNWSDSSKISSKRMAQHNEFMNNQYPYPAKPKDQWELGLSGGYAFWVSDLESRPGFGGSISIRKSLGHVFSIRGQYTGTFTKGYDSKPRNPLTQINAGSSSNPWAVYSGTAQGANGVFTAYRNRTHQGSLELVGSLNNISWYRGNPKTNWYGFIGYTAAGVDVDVDARNGSALYPYNTIVTAGRDKSDIRSQLKNMWDGDYENNAPRGSTTTVGGNYLLVQGVTFGLGVARKLNDKLNIGIEQRFSAFLNDYMDGVNYGASKDILSYTAIRLNINMGNAATHVQPLWWLNPNNFIYNELNRPTHMQLPKPVLPDADNDGVTDQFDLEPNTPAGCPVDTHGVSRDTDGDGVPDCRDKELLTAQNCFPVNADGVGNCPEPPCCAALRDSLKNMQRVTSGNCGLSSLPSVQFRAGAITLSKDAQAVLASAAAQIRSNPDCRVRVVSYGASNKRAQQLSWDRVNAVINYLESQNISRDRFIFSYGNTEGDENTVDLQPTTEEGPNTVPAPHPNLQKK